MLIEVNPRIWGNLDLSIQAGVNFPALLCELALTGDVTPPDSYSVGKKIIWLDEGFAAGLWTAHDRIDYLQYMLREYMSGAETTVEMSDFAPHLVQWLRIGGLGAQEGMNWGLRSIASKVP